MKICTRCSHEELYPGEFEEARGNCPLCGADSYFVEDLDEDEHEDERTR